MLHINTSTVHNGSMKSLDGSYASVLEIRRRFLGAHNIKPEDTTLVHITYDGDDYNRYHSINDDAKGQGITAPTPQQSDALVVTKPGHALFLPLADCIGAVIHDPKKNILMVSHLGRHNLEQFGGTRSIEFLKEHHDVNPADLTVWLSPAAGKNTYPLFAFNNRSLHDEATEQLLRAGVLLENITVSPIDSASDENYYSHSQFLKGNRPNDGRFAIVAVMS
ncbi:MAG: laccase domain-containing protein [Candidatus Saccharibacteria bacterium]